MFNNSEELLKYIKDEGVEMIDVRFCDLPGVMQHFTVPASSFDQSVFDDGLGFDGSSIRGFQAINESDMSLFPDPTTAYIDPFRKSKTLNVNFFIHDPITGEAYSRDPRNIAKKALVQVQVMVRDLLMERMTEEKATDIAVKLSTGTWTHDYAITVEEAKALGLPVTTEMPPEVYELMRLFPQPTRTRPSVEYVPVPYRLPKQP